MHVWHAGLIHLHICFESFQIRIFTTNFGFIFSLFFNPIYFSAFSVAILVLVIAVS